MSTSFITRAVFGLSLKCLDAGEGWLAEMLSNTEGQAVDQCLGLGCSRFVSYLAASYNTNGLPAR